MGKISLSYFSQDSSHFLSDDLYKINVNSIGESYISSCDSDIIFIYFSDHINIDFVKKLMDKNRLIPFVIMYKEISIKELRELFSVNPEKIVDYEESEKIDEIIFNVMLSSIEKKAHSERSKELSLLSFALEQTGQMVTITNRNGIFLYLNNKFIETTKFERTDLKGKKFFDITETYDTEGYKTITDKINSGFTWSGVLKFFSKDAEKILTYTKISPYYDEDQKIKYFIITSEDISTYYLSEEISQKIFDISKDIILLMDRKGNIIKASNSFYDYFSEYMNIKSNIYGYIDKEKKDLLSKNIEKTCDQNFYTFDYELKNPTNSSRWFSWRCVFFREVNLIYAVLNDITEEKLILENLITAKEKAENISKIKNHFIANTNHEIRTPLTTVKSINDILMKKIKDNDILKYVNLQKTALKEISYIVENILDYSKIDNDKVDIKIKDEFFSDIFDDIKKSFLLNFSGKTINCIFENTVPENYVIKTDKIRFKQIIYNILNNSEKYTESGFIKFNSFIKDESLFIMVEDTGIGISEDKIKDIFTPFNKISEKNFENKGLGLGLSITKKLCDLLNISITVSSKEYKGTSVILKSEDVYVNNHRKNETTEISDYNNSLDIFLIEDNIINQMIVKEILESYGMKVTVCGDGKAAYEILKTNKFDLIFMDISIPSMSGTELTEKIRLSDKKTVIIALTAYSTYETQQMCIRCGMNDFISKPFDEETLVQKIKYFFPVKKEPKSNKNSKDEIYKLFVSDYSDKIKKIHSFAENKNTDEIRKIAHQLKNPLKFFNYNNLYSVFCNLENLCEINSSEEIKKIIFTTDFSLK